MAQSWRKLRHRKSKGNGAMEPKNEACPCKKKKCPRHGDCIACREHHAASERKRPVYCQRKNAKRKNRGTAGNLALVAQLTRSLGIPQNQSLGWLLAGLARQVRGGVQELALGGGQHRARLDDQTDNVC